MHCMDPGREAFGLVGAEALSCENLTMISSDDREILDWPVPTRAAALYLAPMRVTKCQRQLRGRQLGGGRRILYQCHGSSPCSLQACGRLTSVRGQSFVAHLSARLRRRWRAVP